MRPCPTSGSPMVGPPARRGGRGRLRPRHSRWRRAGSRPGRAACLTSFRAPRRRWVVGHARLVPDRGACGVQVMRRAGTGRQGGWWRDRGARKCREERVSGRASERARGREEIGRTEDGSQMRGCVERGLTSHLLGRGVKSSTLSPRCALASQGGCARNNNARQKYGTWCWPIARASALPIPSRRRARRAPCLERTGTTPATGCSAHTCLPGRRGGVGTWACGLTNALHCRAPQRCNERAR